MRDFCSSPPNYVKLDSLRLIQYRVYEAQVSQSAVISSRTQVETTYIIYTTHYAAGRESADIIPLLYRCLIEPVESSARRVSDASRTAVALIRDQSLRDAGSVVAPPSELRRNEAATRATYNSTEIQRNSSVGGPRTSCHESSVTAPVRSLVVRSFSS